MADKESTPDTERLQLKQRIDALSAALEHSEVERRQMQESRSWKLTAPLRRFRAWMSGDTPSGSPATSGCTQAKDPLPTLLSRIDRRLRASDALEGLQPSTEVFRPLSFDGVLAGVAGSGDHRGDPSRPSRHGPISLGDAPAARIGFIGGQELREELAHDADVFPLHSEHWEASLATGALDFILIETAWEPDGAWGYGLLRVGEEAEALVALLEQARSRGIPAAVWVRESAANAVRYTWMAPLVSAVFAIDEEVANVIHRSATGVRVEVLPPAVQPRLFNPVRTYALRDAEPAFSGRVLFDGWWDLADRTGANHVLRGLAPDRLAIVDSDWDVGRVRLPDLPDYQDVMLGCLSMQEKAALSKIVPVEYLVESELLPAWRREQRALRAAASGAVVVSEPAFEGRGFGDIDSLMRAGDAPGALVASLIADPLSRARRAHLGFRKTVSAHSLRARIQVMLECLGVRARDASADTSIATVLVSMRPDLVDACLQRFRNQTYADREMIVVLHGEGGLQTLRRGLRDGERAFQFGKERSLADCLNFAIDQTGAAFWAKVDDDDHYGPEYLSDMMLYRRVSRARVWGKPPMFLHSESQDELSWDPVWAQHANLLHRSGEAMHALVAGGTLMGDRSVLETVRFNPRRRGGSDSEFIRQCYLHGLDVLAADGFNFARFRTDKPGFHTWQAPSSELRDRATKVGTGRDVERMAFV